MASKFFPIQASVIICTHRRDKVLVATIDQALAQADGSTEIVTVDQKAQHDLATREYLETKCNEGLIRYFNLDVAGLTHARNFGSTQARGAVLLFCDDDVILSPNWISEHIAMYEDPQISAVAGQVLNVGGQARDAPGSFDHNQPMLTCGALHGANFSIRKSVYERIGGSDENLGVHAYTEDWILAHRLLAGAHRISYCPSARVIHLMSPVGGCRNQRPDAINQGMGEAIFKTILAALKSTTEKVTEIAAFVGYCAPRTLAQGRRCSFLAATRSVVRFRGELLQGEECSAKDTKRIRHLRR